MLINELSQGLSRDLSQDIPSLSQLSQDTPIECKTLEEEHTIRNG
jgi:hypothetical protein